MSISYRDQLRRPRGVPVGGQWAEGQRGVSGLFLDEGASEFGAELLRQRRDALLAQSFVPGVATQAIVAPETTAKRTEWWQTHFVQAEYDNSGGYAQMPDDYTPAKTRGHALSGSRRTHRMRYRTGGVDLRMPSRTAIGRFAAETDNDTFDVPVTASLPGGDVQGWVRVTRGGPGSWTTSGMGFGESSEVLVSEAVGATLEGRAAARSPQQVGDLIARRKERLAREGFEMGEVSSTWISSVGYDAASGVMATMTASGGTVYGHKVDAATFAEVSASRSPGAMFNKLVKGHERAEVTRCPECGRFSAAEAGHTCPRTHKAPRSALDERSLLVRAHATGMAAQAATGARAPVPDGAGTPAAIAGGPGRPDERQPVDKRAAESFDMGSAMERNQYSGYIEPGTHGDYGRRGWTRSLAPAALSKFAFPTYVPYSFNGGTNGDSGMIRFGGVDADAAARLYTQMPREARSDRQNDAPSLGTMLEAAIRHPGRVELEGYVVGPERTDERITADGVYLFDDSLTDERAAMRAAKDTYGLHDATRRPDQVVQVRVPWREDETAWRLWWE